MFTRTHTLPARRRIWAVFTLVLALVLIIPGLGARAHAEAKAVDVKITNFAIQNIEKKDVDHLFWTDRFYLAMSWDASALGATLHEGDLFDVTLPDNMRFPADDPAADFDLLGMDGVTVFAKGHVTPGADGSGGTAHIIFTDAVENKYNVKGTIYLAALFERNLIKKGEINQFSVTVNSQVLTTSIMINLPKDLENEYLSKWGSKSDDSTPENARVMWTMRINHMKAELPNAKITDALTGGTGSETYIDGSFKLLKVEMDSKGELVKVLESVDLAGKLQIAPDKRSFTLDLGDVHKDQYRLRYKTTYAPGTILKNMASLISQEKNWAVEGRYESAASGGTAEGDLASKIKLIKVDAADEKIVLKDAVFTVMKPDGSTFELTTGEDGTVVSGVLEQGMYKVKEKKAPAGYELNDQEFTLNVTPAGGAIQTVTDKKMSVEVSVEKKWEDGGDQDGKRPASITVHLLADGVDTGKTLVLNADMGWKGSFTGLDKVNAAGKQIVYTLGEDPVEGYTPSIEGGLITNTRTPETVDVPVKKVWVGPKGSEVKVKLLADGVELADQELVLNEGNGWKGSFTGLPKYKSGKLIEYTISEAQVAGVDPSKYTVKITGNMSTICGFTITNANIETVDVDGVKTWSDDEDRDGKRSESIVVRLKADGVEKDSKTVTPDAGGRWSYAFAGLPKYTAEGRLIEYTVTEDAVPEYATRIEGKQIINSYTPGKTSVSVTKAWDDAEEQDGKCPESVKVQLFADGKALGSPVELGGSAGWTHTWTDLFLKDKGKEIVYTVEEVEVPEGYKAVVTGDPKAGFTVTNTHAPEVIGVNVQKKWVGEVRAKAVIRLRADGVDTGKSLVLTADKGWKGAFEGLAKYKGGKEIAYTIVEDRIEGYTSRVDKDGAAGFVVTNTQNPKGGLAKTGADAVGVGAMTLLLGGAGALAWGAGRRKKA